MKKLLLTLCVMLAVAIVGCKKKDEATTPQVDANSTKIGIAKIMFHPALNDVEQGIVDVITESKLPVSIDLQNANGDINTAASIANKFKAEGADITVGIATPIAVALANAIEDKPVVFSAITDPISAGLVESMDKGYKNITGASDAVPVDAQLKAFQAIVPFKKLGFIYTSSESNSVSLADQTEKACDAMGIEFIPATISNTSEIKQAAESLIGRVDAFYVVTDNTLVSGVSALASTAAANDVPVFSSDISSSRDGGILMALGFNYYNVGRATGEIVVDIINGKNPADMPVVLLTDPKDYEMLIDLDVAKALNVNLSDDVKAQANHVYENGKLNSK